MTTLKSTADTVAVGAAPSQIPTNGHAVVVPDGDEPGRPSCRLLPAIYSADRFAGRFLRMFKDVLDPVAVIVDNRPYYFDPMTAPLALLDWMAFWVDLDEGESWPLPKKRALIAATAALYRMRGTRESSGTWASIRAACRSSWSAPMVSASIEMPASASIPP